MEYKGTFKLRDNAEQLSSSDEVLKFERMVFAGLSRRLGITTGITIEAKVENGCNTFGIVFPENKEGAVKEILDYMNEHFYEIKYNGDKNG